MSDAELGIGVTGYVMFRKESLGRSGDGVILYIYIYIYIYIRRIMI